MIVFKRAVHFGSITGLTDDPRQLFTKVAELAAVAEQSGFDAIFVPDHLVQGQIGGGPEQPVFEAYTLLGALAARTTSVSLGSMVSPITLHNPGQLAKRITSLDVISGGRAIAGLGAGWDDKESSEYGIAFPPVRERMDRLAEALTICRAVFDEERPIINGRFYAIDRPHNVPRPLSRIPILVGGGGERRTLRLVAEYADAGNVQGDLPTVIAKFAALARHCADVGRNPDDVQKTVGVPLPADDPDGFRRAVEERVQAGATGVVVLVTPDPVVLAATGRVLQQLVP